MIPWYTVAPAPKMNIPTPLIRAYTYLARENPYLHGNEEWENRNGITKRVSQYKVVLEGQIFLANYKFFVDWPIFIFGKLAEMANFVKKPYATNNH